MSIEQLSAKVDVLKNSYSIPIVHLHNIQKQDTNISNLTKNVMNYLKK